MPQLAEIVAFPWCCWFGFFAVDLVGFCVDFLLYFLFGLVACFGGFVWFGGVFLVVWVLRFCWFGIFGLVGWGDMGLVLVFPIRLALGRNRREGEQQ